MLWFFSPAVYKHVYTYILLYVHGRKRRRRGRRRRRSRWQKRVYMRTVESGGYERFRGRKAK